MYLKDLRILTGVEQKDVIIVDNQLLSFALQPDNGIPISSYFYDPNDTELRCLADYLLQNIVFCEPNNTDSNGCTDVRNVNRA